MAQMTGLPEGGELWNVDGQAWVVYFVPGSTPPVPMAWKVNEAGDLEGFFPNGSVAYDKTISGDQFRSTGALDMGVSREIRTQETTPWDTIVAQVESEARVAPWLKDPEMMAVIVGAALEDRAPTAAEFQATDWWQSHTESERKWLSLWHGDRSTAVELREDNRIKVRDLLLEVGITDPPQQVVNLLADNMTAGSWSTDFVREQARMLGDPFTFAGLDSSVREVLDGVTLDTNKGRQAKVRDLVNQWLGPAVAAQWSDNQFAQWASQLRTDPNAEQRLIDHLRTQRTVYLDAWENPDLSYEDLAPRARQLVTSVWGEVPDESDPIFLKVLNTRDMNAATQLLRQEGIKRGKRQTVQEASAGLLRSVGGQTVRGF